MTTPAEIPKQALGHTRPTGRARYRQDWYRIKYAAAATYANLDAGGAKIPLQAGTAPEYGPDAYLHALELARVCCATLHELGPLRLAWPGNWGLLFNTRHAERTLLREFLEQSIEPAALTIVVAFSPREHSDERPSPPSKRQLRTLIEDDEPDPALLLAFVESRDHSARVDYNLACLYTARKQWGDAVAALTRALDSSPREEVARLAQRALGDDSLKDLWGSNPGGELHKELGSISQPQAVPLSFTA